MVIFSNKQCRKLHFRHLNDISVFNLVKIYGYFIIIFVCIQNVTMQTIIPKEMNMPHDTTTSYRNRYNANNQNQNSINNQIYANLKIKNIEQRAILLNYSTISELLFPLSTLSILPTDVTTEKKHLNDDNNTNNGSINCNCSENLSIIMKQSNCHHEMCNNKIENKIDIQLNKKMSSSARIESKEPNNGNQLPERQCNSTHNDFNRANKNPHHHHHHRRRRRRHHHINKKRMLMNVLLQSNDFNYEHSLKQHKKVKLILKRELTIDGNMKSTDINAETLATRNTFNNRTANVIDVYDIHGVDNGDVDIDADVDVNETSLANFSRSSENSITDAQTLTANASVRDYFIDHTAYSLSISDGAGVSISNENYLVDDVNETCTDEKLCFHENITCVGDPIYCNYTYEEYVQMLYDYLYPTIPEWILICSHTIVFFMGLVSIFFH